MNKEQIIKIEAQYNELEIASEQISDFLCWIDGYQSGEGHYHYGTNAIIELNAKIKDRLHEFENGIVRK
jgi:hypothetical protein